MDDVGDQVGGKLRIDAVDVAQRVGGEVPRRAVIDMLILLARRHDHRRAEVADDPGELLRQVLAAKLGGLRSGPSTEAGDRAAYTANGTRHAAPTSTAASACRARRRES